MRTTLDLPSPLVAEAMKVSHHRTKTAVIVTALEEYVRKNRIQGLRKFQGTVDLDVDLNTLRKRR
ncbi:MAG: type II toxin-antitoxin system VapB family antitoxin [Candidatus Pacebacteria bacterium]|nr:type II toxin-antitoxin system VapB family antitoxin [Candidatus Paceibacterota bacterium]